MATLQALVAALDAMLPAAPAAGLPALAGGAPDAQDRALLDRLAALLDDSDADAVELLASEAERLGRGLGGAYAQVRSAAAGYEFERAAALVRQALESG